MEAKYRGKTFTLSHAYIMYDPLPGDRYVGKILFDKQRISNGSVPIPRIIDGKSLDYALEIFIDNENVVNDGGRDFQINGVGFDFKGEEGSKTLVIPLREWHSMGKPKTIVGE